MKKKKIIVWGCIVILLFGFIVYCHLENTNIETTKIRITDSNIPVGFDGYKIVQISDLHNTEFGNNNEVLLNKIRENNPDAIFITGDIVDRRRTNMEVAVHFVEQASKIAPIYYVAGNHEASLKKYPKLAEEMESLGVNILNNDFAVLAKDGYEMNIVGFADPSFVRDFGTDSSLVFSKYLGEMNIDLSHYTILLSHRPELFDFYTENKMNLVFCGHAHGGQFRIPFIGGIVAPNQGLFPKYTSGIYEKENTKMIVSRGLGNSIFPIRMNNNPELIVVTLGILESAISICP